MSLLDLKKLDLMHSLGITPDAPTSPDISPIPEQTSIISSSLAYSDCMIEDDPSYSMGGWEKHTRGVGGKLMARMGYVRGKGLGLGGVGVVRAPPMVLILSPLH